MLTASLAKSFNLIIILDFFKVICYISVCNILPDRVFVLTGEKLPISVKDFQHNLICLLRFMNSIDDNWHSARQISH